MCVCIHTYVHAYVLKIACLSFYSYVNYCLTLVASNYILFHKMYVCAYLCACIGVNCVFPT